MKEPTQKQAEKSLDSKLIFLLACLLKNENGEMVLRGYFISRAGLSHIYLHNKNLNAWQQTLRIDFTVIAVIQMKKKIIILLNYSYVNQFIQCALNGVNDLELKVESLPHMCDNTSRNILSQHFTEYNVLSLLVNSMISYKSE